MSLEKPEIIRLERSGLSVYYQHDFTYFDSELKMTQHLHAGIISLGEDSGNFPPGTELTAGWYATADKIPQDALLALVRFKNLINSCINHAEVINRALLEITRRFLNKGKTDISGISHLDFMSLKDGVMKYVKSERNLAVLTNKSFRRSLDNFITYRNIFTHGELCLIYTSDGDLIRDEYYLRFIDKSTKITVITPVNSQLAKIYIETYAEILTFINEFNRATLHK